MVPISTVWGKLIRSRHLKVFSRIAFTSILKSSLRRIPCLRSVASLSIQAIPFNTINVSATSRVEARRCPLRRSKPRRLSVPSHTANMARACCSILTEQVGQIECVMLKAESPSDSFTPIKVPHHAHFIVNCILIVFYDSNGAIVTLPSRPRREARIHESRPPLCDALVVPGISMITLRSQP